MRIILSKKAKKLLIAAAIIIAAVAVTLNVIGCCTGAAYLSVFAPARNDHEVRSRLLQEAMLEVGACSPEKAASIWAEGLKRRSAALQYSVMTKKLRTLYAAELEKNHPNWVTGISSPWVDSFTITQVPTRGQDRVYRLSFHTLTSTGPAGVYKAALHITEEDGYWRISRIETDKGLTPYTGTQPILPPA